MEQPLIEQKKNESKAVKIFMITALVEVVAQVGIFAYDLSRYSPETIPNAFGYLTVWQLTLLALTSVVAVGQLLKVYWATKDKTPEQRNQEIMKLKNEPSGWRSLSFGVSILATGLFWGILSSTSDNLGLSFVFHGLGMLISLTVICLNRLNIAKGTLPARCDKSSTDEQKEIKAVNGVKGFFQNNHYSRNLIFGGVYAIFTVGFTLGGLSNPDGQHYIYKVLDWNNDPSTAGIYIGIGVVGMLAVTLLSGAIEKLTHRVHDNCIEGEVVNAPAT